ncbi:MAG: YHS domain-containing protein [Bacteroidetes bacterium]|nr:MAG: YHS domain-containing protein [Bacteroidota bacterium]
MTRTGIFLSFLSLLSLLPAGTGFAQTEKHYLVNVNKQGVILDGYDPVSLRDGKPVKGTSTCTSTYHGAVYYFENGQNKQRFDQDPSKYEPEFGGFCAYGVATRTLVGIDVQTYDTSFQDRNIYNYNKSIARKWEKDPAGWYKKAKANWSELVDAAQKKANH